VTYADAIQFLYDLRWFGAKFGLANTFKLAALAGNPPVLRSNGLFVRDYIYVEDVVDAYLALAAGADRAEVRGHGFNFSPERPLTVLEITRATLAALGRPDLEPVILDTARAEIKDQYLDSGKARQVLAWAPRHGLEAGLEATVAWYRTFLGGDR